MLRINISDAFDGGNIEFVETEEEDDGMLTVSLRIKEDPYTELEKAYHSQYFCFRSTVSGMSKKTKDDKNGGDNKAPIKVKYVIVNAGDVSYPEAWDGTTTFYSHNVEDSESWKRNLGTKYEEEKLCWIHEHRSNGSLYFSFFPPYSYSRHLNLISKCCMYGAEVESLGQSLDGREIECVSVGTGDRTCWIIHRQHPGESMAEYYAEGLLSRLLGLNNQNGEVDGLVSLMLRMYTFYIIPNMNPDGSVRGHLRTNACGANLNREWATLSEGDYTAPTLERSPEVYHVLSKMDETGCDVFLDIHGDEELPYSFLFGGAEGTSAWSKRIQSMHGAFLASYARTNSDIQKRVGYDNPPTPEDPVLANIACKQIAARFECFAATLEMPFKDCASNPNPIFGWSPNRARMLGSSVLDPLAYIHPYLRSKNEFWENLPSEDVYIPPKEVW